MILKVLRMKWSQYLIWSIINIYIAKQHFNEQVRWVLGASKGKSVVKLPTD